MLLKILIKHAIFICQEGAISFPNFIEFVKKLQRKHYISINYKFVHTTNCTICRIH